MMPEGFYPSWTALRWCIIHSSLPMHVCMSRAWGLYLPNHGCFPAQINQFWWNSGLFPIVSLQRNTIGWLAIEMNIGKVFLWIIDKPGKFDRWWMNGSYVQFNCWWFINMDVQATKITKTFVGQRIFSGNQHQSAETGIASIAVMLSLATPWVRWENSPGISINGRLKTQWWCRRFQFMSSSDCTVSGTVIWLWVNISQPKNVLVNIPTATIWVVFFLYWL